MYKLTAWGNLFTHEAWLPIIAQGDTVIEKGYDAITKGGTDFGNASDSVRFGIILFAFLGVVGSLAWLYVSGQRLSIKKLEDRNAELEKEIRANRASYETKYDELRDNCKKENEAYKGLMTMAVHEIGRNNQWLQQQNYIPRPNEPPPAMMRLPASTPEPPSRPSSFLPQTRRIPPKPFGGNRHDPKEDNK